MGVADDTCKPPSGMQLDILVSDECLQPIEIQLLKWICSAEAEQDTSSIWEEILYSKRNHSKKKKMLKRCCKELICKKEKAVCELFRFMKIIKEYVANVKRYGPRDKGDNCKYMSIEPTYVLAHLSAKLLQFEKRLKKMKCSKNDTCRLAKLIKSTKRNILLQFICEPRANETLAKTVRDIAFIDCLLKNLEEICHCPTEISNIDDVSDREFSTAIAKTSNKAGNTSRIYYRDEESLVISEKKDKGTCYDLFCKHKKYALDWNPSSYRRMFYTYRKENNTKATEFGNHNPNLTYYYDVRQINRYTSNTDIPFKGEIIYPSEEKKLVDKRTQTDVYLTFNETYEITAVCIRYSNKKFVKELDHIPKLENVRNDFFTSDFYHNEKETGVKNYMTSIDGINILAETNTKLNSDIINLIYNTDATITHPITGNSPITDSKLIVFKQEIFSEAKKLASQVVHNFISNKNRNN